MKQIIKELIEALEKSKRYHDYCEDSWYSCPLHPEGCSNDSLVKQCNCGADEWNNFIMPLIERAKEELK